MERRHASLVVASCVARTRQAASRYKVTVATKEQCKYVCVCTYVVVCPRISAILVLLVSFSVISHNFRVILLLLSLVSLPLYLSLCV